MRIFGIFTRRIFDVLTIGLRGILSLFLRSRSTSRIHGNLAAFCYFAVFERLPSYIRGILIVYVLSTLHSEKGVSEKQVPTACIGISKRRAHV